MKRGEEGKEGTKLNLLFGIDNVFYQVYLLDSYSDDDLMSGLVSSLQAAMVSTELQDFKLICKGRTFSCNKFMLMSRSDVFKAMLSHQGTAESQKNSLTIKDSTPEVVETFLQLLYTGQAQMTQHCLRYFSNNNIKQALTEC